MAEIYTSKGMVEASTLSYRRVVIDNENEYTIREEWRDASGAVVKSNVHVTLKKGMFADLIQGEIG